jgi:hypothetical protein
MFASQDARRPHGAAGLAAADAGAHRSMRRRRREVTSSF